MTFSQPDPARPAEILGTCDNRGCREWVILHLREGGRWRVMERIPPGRRDPRNLAWTPARPAALDTALRA